MNNLISINLTTQMKWTHNSEILKQLTKEKIDNVNSSTSLKRLIILKNLSQKKTPGPDGFMGKNIPKI